MRGIILALSGLLLLAASVAVHAQFPYTNADGSMYTYSTNADGSATIDAYAGPPWDVTIPTNINGLLVTSITNDAFYFCLSIGSAASVSRINGSPVPWHSSPAAEVWKAVRRAKRSVALDPTRHWREHGVRWWLRLYSAAAVRE